MALQGKETAPATQGKIPFFIIEAVRHVDFSEYLQLRFQKGRDCADREYGQMLDAADIIQELAESAEKEGKTYKMGNEIEFSINPRIIGARMVLKNTPLEIYLTAKRITIKEALEKNARKEILYANIKGLEKEQSNIEIRRQELAAQWELVNKIVWITSGAPDQP